MLVTEEDKQRLTDAYNKFMADQTDENWNELWDAILGTIRT